jgi:HlyD family secretion protein
MKSPEKLILPLIIAALAICGFGIAVALRPAQTPKALSSATASPGASPGASAGASPGAEGSSTADKKTGAITALGRLEPQGGVLKVAAPSSGQGGSARVARLMVKEGDRVKQGQPLAILDSYERLRAEALQAQAQVREAEAKVAKVKAGAKTGDIGSQIAQAQSQVETVRAKEAQINAQLAQLQSWQATVDSRAKAIEAQLEAARVKEAKVRSAGAQLDKVQRDLQRYNALAKDGVIAQADLDTRQLTVQTAVQDLEASKREFEQAMSIAQQAQQEKLKAQADLDTAQKQIAQLMRERDQNIASVEAAKQDISSVRQVRPEDVLEAQTGVQVALANFERAKVELNNAVIVSPQPGQILKIHSEAGEAVDSANGLLDLGRTQQMDAVAEVYETDAGAIQPGQKAFISSPALPRRLIGQVYQVALQVRKNDVLNTDPAADTDTRVIEVKVKLLDSPAVAGLTNLQVNVEIQP